MSTTNAAPSSFTNQPGLTQRRVPQPHESDEIHRTYCNETDLIAQTLRVPHDPQKSRSFDDEHPYHRIGTKNQRLSYSESFADAEDLRAAALRRYVETWKSNFVLTLGKNYWGNTMLGIALTTLNNRWRRRSRLFAADNSSTFNGKGCKDRA